MSLSDNYLRKGAEFRQWRSISRILSSKRRFPEWERSLRERGRWRREERSLAAPKDEWSPGRTSRPENIEYIARCFIHCPIDHSHSGDPYRMDPKRPCLCSLLRHQSSDCVITVRSHALSLPFPLPASLHWEGSLYSRHREEWGSWNCRYLECHAIWLYCPSVSIDSCCSASSHPSFAPCFPWRKTPCWILFLPVSLLRCPLSPILPVTSLHYAIAWSSSPMLHW